MKIVLTSTGVDHASVSMSNIKVLSQDREWHKTQSQGRFTSNSTLKISTYLDLLSLF